MRILFCSNPLNNREVDFDYELEFKTANEVGLKTDLIILEELVQGNTRKAISRVKEAETEDLAIYRGWMMSIENYESLYTELLKKNIKLINSPTEYKYCHYLPESYHKIEGYTPKTIWIKKGELNNSFDILHKLIKEFDNKPVIVKDYVKSCKHQWNDACFIPDASDLKNFDRVVKNLIELRGEDFEGGIIVREFIKLEFLTEHSKSKMPLAKEFRLFFLSKNLLQSFYYWDEGEYNDEIPSGKEISDLLKLANNIDSQFFTMDIAKTATGTWTIIELGDGQVSGLPFNADLKKFYIGILEGNCK
jgi:hypothetical protein